MEIRLLGPMDVRVDGQPMPPLRSRKGYYLLALLTLWHDREVDRLHLAGMLWPESEEEQGRVSLRRSLADLRQALGGEGKRITSPTSRTLHLELTGAFADIRVFDQGISSRDLTQVAEAVDVYRGPLLEGWTEEWVVPEREGRTESFLGGLERLAEEAIRQQDTESAVQRLRRVISHDPLRESAVRALMNALALRGDYASLTLAYRELRAHLRETMNAEPSQETTALYQRCREEGQRRAAGTAHTPETATTSATSEPEPETPQIPEPEKPQPVRETPHNLPRSLTPLIGRTRELETVLAQLPGARLVSLTGMGGMGKTRLSTEIGWQVLPIFPEGVWFVDLAAVADEGHIATAVAGAMNLREEPGLAPLALVQNALARNRTLLILDNCEHLIGGCAAFVQSVLTRCPEVKALATSRQSLGIPGEVILPLSSLPLPEWEEATTPSLESALRFDAIRLFTERASAASPTFRLTTGNLSDTLRVCHYLDGIPLALELAAARVKALSVGQIAERLTDRFRLLVAPNRVAPPRQQTLQSLIAWSYDLLTPPEQALLRRLTAFSGGCTLEAAEQICSGDVVSEYDVVELLAQLVEKSLVIAEDSETGQRYRLLETVRHFGQERLQETGEAETLAERHRDWFLEWAELAFSQMTTTHANQWMSRLRADHENLRQALRWSVDGDARLRFAAALWPYWLHWGFNQEGRAWLESVLQNRGNDPPVRRLASALHGLGQMAWRMTDNDTAQVAYLEAKEWYVALGDRRSIASMDLGLGVIALDRDDIETALALFTASRETYEELGDQSGKLRAMQNLGVLYRNQNRLEEALQIFKDSITLAQAIGNDRNLISAFGNLASTAYGLGDYVTAREYWGKCLVMDRERHYAWGIVSTLCHLGFVYLRLGNVIEAVRLLAEGLPATDRIGDRRLLVRYLEGAAEVAVGDGNPEDALHLLSGSSLLMQQAGLTRTTYHHEEYSTCMAEVTRQLGEQEYTLAWSAGATMTSEQLVELGMRVLLHRPQPRHPLLPAIGDAGENTAGFRFPSAQNWERGSGNETE